MLFDLPEAKEACDAQRVSHSRDVRRGGWERLSAARVGGFRSLNDANRGPYGENRQPGQAAQHRLDLVAARADGDFLVLHPGRRAKDSSQPSVIARADYMA